MASPVSDYDWLGAAINWGVPVVFYAGATWAAYKQMVKRQDSHEERISNLESTVAKGVRPEDIKLVRNDISELRKDIRAVLGARE